MAEGSLNSPAAHTPPLRQRLGFGPFTLDLGRAELLRDGQALPLRPKAFDLLTALAQRPGQVVSKDELVAAVWPGVVVTDDSLTQCVYELRSALGDAGPALLFNSWVADRPAALRRHEEATANLERLYRDGTHTYGARAFQLVVKRDFPALLRLTTEWTERYGLPLAWCAHGPALYFNGRFDEAVPVLERGLRLSPRDPFRGECQYRLAMAHFSAGRYELARDWSQTAAQTSAALPWPPVHAAALQRLGRHDEARQAFAEHMRRHPGITAAQVTNRLPSQEPRFVEARERLVGSLRELGLR
jgi:tetratricopeptide (TPR) repeat protein